MRKRVVLSVIFCLLLAGGILTGIFWDPIIDWLPIDQSGWHTLKDGGTCYLDEDGDPVTGWKTLDGNTYYFDPVTCSMQTGWLETDDGRYYLGSDGIRKTGWQTVDGLRYYLNDAGLMQTGWQEADGHRIYLNANGNPHTGWLEQDTGRMYLNESSQVHTGWLKLEDGTYYFDRNGIMQTGWLEIDQTRYYLDENGLLSSGWLKLEEGTFYLNSDGTPATGWQTIGEELFYLDESGIMQTGWLELDGDTYYLKEDGTAARGKLIIDDTIYYFTSRGAQVILVNRWNLLDRNYLPELSEPVKDCWMEVGCHDATVAMFRDLEAAVGDTGILNGYRSYGTQYHGFFDKIENLIKKGISYTAAYDAVIRAFAYPGSSEHQLGVAVDIMGRTDTYYENGENEVIRWMKEHCWEYGFILRYPENKSHITGIIYEPWHFRYVGVELAMELKDSGLCLEEYLDKLTNDGTTCGNPDALNTN